MAGAAVRRGPTCGVPYHLRRSSRRSHRLSIPPRSSARWVRHSCRVRRHTQSITWRLLSSVPLPSREPWLRPPGLVPSRTTTEASSLGLSCERGSQAVGPRARCLLLPCLGGGDGGAVVFCGCVCELRFFSGAPGPQQYERESYAGADRSRSDQEREVVAADQGGGESLVAGEQRLGAVGRHGAVDGKPERTADLLRDVGDAGTVQGGYGRVVGDRTRVQSP